MRRADHDNYAYTDTSIIMLKTQPEVSYTLLKLYLLLPYFLPVHLICISYHHSALSSILRLLYIEMFRVNTAQNLQLQEKYNEKNISRAT
jgi:hypothetical protein